MRDALILFRRAISVLQIVYKLLSVFNGKLLIFLGNNVSQRTTSRDA